MASSSKKKTTSIMDKATELMFQQLVKQEVRKILAKEFPKIREKVSSLPSRSKKIKLRSSDGILFEMEEAAAVESQSIKFVIDDGGANNVITVLNVSSKYLGKVIEYCQKHVQFGKSSDPGVIEEFLKWDAEFVNVDRITLFGILNAANSLNVKGLLDLTCQTLIHTIKNNTPEASVDEELQKMKTMGWSWPSPSKKITLRSSDGLFFEVEEAMAVESQTIKLLISYGRANNVIPLPNVNGMILGKVLEYCNKHVQFDASSDPRVLKWDAEFVNVDLLTLFDILNAANSLNVKKLLDLTCRTVANMIQNKTPEAMKVFNVRNDFTAEEEAQMRSRYQWAFVD